MDLRQQLLRRRNDRRFIFGGLSLLLAVLISIFFLLQRGQGQSPSALANRLLLFVLWYVNVILILIILFVLLRSIFRLLLDRRSRILGSKFQTRLVLTAIALALIPVLILFPLATQLLLDSFDQWFSLPIEDVVEQAAETAQELSRQIEETNQRDARRVLNEIESIDLDDVNQYPALSHRLQELREELQADYLAVYDAAEPIHATADPRAGFRRDLRFRGLKPFLREAVRQGGAVHVEDAPEIDGRLILAAAAQRRETAAQGDSALPEELAGAPEPAQTVAVVGTVLPPDLARKSEFLLRSYEHYLQLMVQRDDLRASYLLLLLMVTLLVMLAFTTIGLRLTRRITVPIQALAEGTRRVSSGDLDHRVRVTAVDEELAVVLDSFNRMTEELQRNKQRAERSTQELVEANKRTAAILHNVAAGVVAISADGRIRTCNGAALEILNQPADRVVGLSVEEAWSDSERRQLIELVEQGQTPGHEVRHEVRLTVGGVWKTLEVKVTSLPAPSGEQGAKVLVLEDLTELLYAQKMAAWTEVARRIAHEIKNPLTPIKLTAERLLRKHQQQDPALGEVLEKGVETIVREVASMKSMVDEFSRYARMPRPQPIEINLDRFLSEAATLYQGVKPGVEIELDISGEAQIIHFDREQFRSVVVNLLDNAMEWTEAPGTIRVSTHPLSQGGVRLRVADSGRGVRPEDKEKLFLPYYSTKGRGTGLGLAIVQRIVTDHHARIRVEENQPRGAAFVVEIPGQSASFIG